MHLQKKKNKSGSTSIQIRQREAAGSKLVKTIGCSSDAGIIEQLMIQGKLEINRLSGQQPINFDALKEKELVDVFPDASTDLHLTVVYPTGKKLPEAGVTLTVAEQLSVAATV